MIKIGDKEVLYSPEDEEIISKYNWRVNEKNYVIAKIDGKIVRLHRMLMDASRGELVDHADSDPLDNRREKIRITTPKGNAENQKKRQGTSSQYIGVFKTPSNKFSASISFNKIK